MVWNRGGIGASSTDGPCRHSLPVRPEHAAVTVICMPPASRSSTRQIKRRPKDRKIQIARAATDAFSELGYHAVSMENIAARVGISAAALYRHSQGKYDLFRDVLLALGQQLVDATAFADALSADDDPEESLRAVISALIETTIVNRTAGGLYRWEGRYLRGDDQRALAEQSKLTNRRVQRPLIRLRPKLSSRQRWVLSAATLSAIGSITDHRSRLGNAEIRATLADIALAVLKTDLPAWRASGSGSTRASRITSAAGSYELLLHESMRLFNEHGYRETGMEDLAAAVGIPVASIYQYFPGKAAILAVSYRRAADQLSGDLSTILATSGDPEQALARLIDAYVTRSFASPEVACVYYTERHNLTDADAALLYNIQRSTVESWARLAVEARPELTLGRARYAVHAAFALAVDIGRLVHPNTGQPARMTVRRLMEVTVLGRPARRSR
jgi:AcrR family transcriptional regulator